MNPAGNQGLDYRRAIEALRNGVPNGSAVSMLGCAQARAESRFDELLSAAGERDNPPSSGLGMLVSGDFGAGKSHLLTYLEQRALAQGFACSKVVISKETPLYDLSKVFSSAMDSSRIPGRSGRLVEEIGLTFSSEDQEYADFFRRADQDAARGHISAIFPASLLVYTRSHDSELRGKIERFWAGERIRISELKDGLRQLGAQRTYQFRAPKAAELPSQRLRFAVELIKGAGYRGWVVLLDEIELVGSYSPLQRGRSYAELARWLGKLESETYPGLVTVATVTEDFHSAVISEDGRKKDRSHVVRKLQDRERYQAIAPHAASGMNLLERERVPLQEPGREDVEVALEKLRDMYSQAYAWEAPPAMHDMLDGVADRARMRYKVRAAISQWDILRLYPSARPDTVSAEFHHEYQEDPDLEQELKDDGDAPGAE